MEPDYYQKGLHWDDIAAQTQRNHELGWQTTIELDDPIGPLGTRTFRCRLCDREGRPLEEATVDVVAFPHARGDERELLTLQPAGKGVYEASSRFRRKGLWEFRFVVRRNNELFTQVVRRDVYPPGESRPWRR